MFLLSLALASLLRHPPLPDRRAALVGHPPLPDRRAALVGAAGAVLLPRRACARAPGSEDVGEALAQIRDAAVALKALRRDWASYALIDAEGRAGDVNPARRILGGVAPQRGQEAFDVAIATPLYRCDKAFDAVRKAALNADSGWLASFDIEDFVERSDGKPRHSPATSCRPARPRLSAHVIGAAQGPMSSGASRAKRSSGKTAIAT